MRGPTGSDQREQMNKESIRLSRFLAMCGFGSRRYCETLVKSGHVVLNGSTVQNPGVCFDPHTARILVDGESALQPGKMVYMLFNKPPKTLVTMEDPGGRPTVADYIAGIDVRIFPVGRLDFETTGLLLLTNDGLLAHRLMHPSFQVDRIYRAVVSGRIESGSVSRLLKGIRLSDGTAVMERVTVCRTSKKDSLLEVVLREGRNRVVRRMMAKAGHPVKRLERIGLGPLRLGRLKQGTLKKLRKEEVSLLRRAVHLDD